MTTSKLCPDVKAFQDLENGCLPTECIEPLLQHLEICSVCVEKVQSLHFSDTLPENIRSAATRIHVPEIAAVQSLIDQLSHLSPQQLPEATSDFVEEVGCPNFGQGMGELTHLGTFRLLRELGRGGMGIVYEAEDGQLERRVALKVLRSGHSEARKRFLHEARAAAAVKHDHIVSIYQVGEHFGIPFLAMELLEGESLDQCLARIGKLEVVELLRLGRQIAVGLQAAHDKGLLHRDVKPSNIWIESNTGRIKILDFGLASTASSKARFGPELAGTPGYMAPEQTCGASVDQRCDLFSLGCVLYRMCTGTVPFRGRSPMELLKSSKVDAPQPVGELNADIPSPLADLIMQLLAKDPSERPNSAQVVVDALTGMAQSPVDRKPSRPGWRRLALAASMLILLGGVLAQAVIIRITHKDGSVTKIESEGKVEVVSPSKDNGKKDNGKSQPPLVVAVKDSLFDTYRRDQLTTEQLTLAGGGTAKNAPAGIVAFLQRKNPAQIVSLALHPDGRHLIVGDTQFSLCVWDLTTRTHVATYPAEAVGTHRLGLSFSSNGQRLATMIWEAKPAVFESANAAALLERPLFIMNNFGAFSTALSPDGTLLAACDLARNLLVWEVELGRLLVNAKVHAGGIHQVVFSPDGTRLATASADGTVKLWEARSGRHLQTMVGARGG